MRLARNVVAFAIVLTGAACGLDLTGTANLSTDDDGGTTGTDGSMDAPGHADATSGTDGSSARDTASDTATLPDTAPPVDAGIDTGVDACGPIVVIRDDFGSGIGAAWTKVGSATATTAGGANGPFVTLTPLQGGQQGELLYATAQPLGTFRVDFQFYMSTGGQSPVADGLTFAWFDRATGFGTAVGGKGLGLPRTTGGYAVTFDTWQNTDINDPSSPYFGVLKLDSAKDPGTFDWHGGSSSQLPLIAGVWHTAQIVVVAGNVRLIVDTIPFLSGITTTPIVSGAFGFTAATGGGNPIGVALDNVVFAIPNPACPSAFP